jgi:ABC-type multidrug transport system permease subunit
MKGFWAILVARNKEFYRDTGAMAWNILFPVLVVLGFSFAFSGSNQDLFKAAIVDHATVGAFRDTKFVQFIDAPSGGLDETLLKLRRHQVDVVVAPGAGAPGTAGGPRYWINESSPKGYLLEKLLREAAAGAPLTKGTVEGREIRYVDWLISGLLAMNMMFSALFGVGYTIVRYRKNGVLKRLKATPLGPFSFLLAQVASRLWLITVLTAAIFAGCHALVHFRMEGSYFDLALVMVMGAMCLISLGLLVAARISSEELAGGVLNLITWPMMFLSGVWFSLEGAHPAVRMAAQAFPLTHVIDAARAIMTEGATLGMVAPHLAVLAAMTAAFLALGTWVFRWQ